MNPHLQRALILLQQNRPDLAEPELRQALAADPDEPFAHSLLANCLCERDELSEATDEAQRAIALAPDAPFGHSALAHVMLRRNYRDEAREAIAEAIRLDAFNADYFGQLAGIEFARRDWPATLDAADTGLRLDPEHIACNNFRAMALVQLGRRAEAGRAMGSVLALDPENAFSHANQGWALLHEGQPVKALEHFREALRLEPGMDYARRGLVEALKARNPIYSLVLRYFLFMNRLSLRSQWLIILGGVFGMRALDSVANQNPGFEPFVLPVRIAYVIFVIMTWISSPLFNLLLFANRQGRHALSKSQKREALMVGALVGLALAALAAWIVTPLGYYLAILTGLFIIPVSGIYKVPRGWPRAIMALYSTGLLLVLLAFFAAMILGGGEILILMFIWGCVGAAVLVNVLLMVNVRR
jgi:Tfp pilus assembly protein PilF